MSYEPEVILDKTGNPTVAEPGTITYSMPFYNNSDKASAGLTLSSGGVYAPLTIQDLVPEGLQYICGTADVINPEPSTLGYTIRYSKDSGATWGTETETWAGCSTSGTYVSPDIGKRIALRFELTEPLPKKTSTPAPGATATFQAGVPSGYTSGGGSPLVENCAQASFGGGAPFAEECASTLVEGTGSIGDRVWQDENRDGNQTGESGISGIKVSLYYDKNGDGKLDSNDVWLMDQDTSGTGTSNYDFTQLPAGKYIVKVDSTDSELPTGYGPTTASYYAVTLAAGQDYDDADFGFGPSLRVDKHLESLAPAYVGETVTFQIDLVNRLPGDGTVNGYCVYNLWAGAASTGSPPKDFGTVANAVGAPNLNYAIGDFATGSNKELVGSSYSSGGRTSSISKVEVLANVYFDAFFTNDDLTVTVNGTTGPWSTIFTETELNAYAPAEAKKGNLIREIPATSAPGGSWDWLDFAGLSMTFAATKDGGADISKIYVDALGFRVTTTDASCGDANTTIALLPFTDTYDANILEFLSAEPTPTSSSVSGSTGTLSWSNLGPLYAGGTRSITVNFTAKATIADPGTTNTGSVSGAKFSSGRSVNNASDDATVVINASGSLAGVIWADRDNSGWSGTAATGGTGYNTGDTFIPGTHVELYMCVDATTQLPIPLSAASGSATCTSVGGTWKLIRTTYTDASGAYLFSGLRDGFYNVKVVETTLPAGFNQPTSRRAEPDAAGLGDGVTCSTGCDGAWYAGTEKLTAIDSINNGTTGDTASSKVSFGYQDDNDNQGAVIGYVWHDLNGNGAWDTGELPIAGITAELCSDADCTTVVQTTTTDAQGRYTFGNVTPGNYYVRVTPPNGMTQSGDPDGSLDNKTTSAFAVVANNISGPYNFGYTGGYTIGDTVYTDWNGDGGQDTGEEGISGVKVRLYRDLNANGVVDAGDTLLSTATTDANGFYQFTNLPGNGADYLVMVDSGTVPAGYVQTADRDSTKDHKTVVELTDASVNDADFGYRPRGYSSIGDTVWYDNNGNGVQDASESGINGVTVNLYQDQDGDGVIDSEDALVATTLTGIAIKDGYLDLDGDGNIADADDDSPALLGIRVIDGKLDINNDGVVNGNDDGSFAGYTVIDGLLDVNGVGGVTTDDDGTLSGLYQFRNLAAGNYIVDIADSNFNSGQPLHSLLQTYDQDSATVRDNQDSVALGANETYVLGDFGYTSSSIGDLIWQDNNGDGMWQSNEPGIPDVVVELYCDPNNTGSLTGSGVTLCGSTTTDTDGLYLFGGLAPNNYLVKVADSNFGTGGALKDYTLTADPNSYNTTPGETSISCLATGAQECDGVNPLKGITVENVDSTTTFFYGLQLGQNDMSSDFGYKPPTRTIGDTVWIDGDGDSTRDTGEEGIPYITVQLFCASTDPTCATPPQTTETDENGDYTFAGLDNNTTYYVRVVSTDPDFPAELGLTPTYDLDGAAITLHSTAVAVGTTDRYDVDFGYRFSGNNSINGTAWYDADAGGQTDGIGDIDGSETLRYGGVPVYLWNCVNGCGGTDDILVATTTTAANGTYNFPDLANGTYRVSLNGNAPEVSGMTSTTGTSYSDIDLAGSTAARRDFGFDADIDYGDLPDTYGTTVANNGAGHIVGGLSLGTSVVASTDGNPTAGADGDNSIDDNGITFGSESWEPGNTVSLNASVSGANGYLVGWFDWNGDGKFGDGEMEIFGNVVDGANPLSLKVPADASNGGSFINMRFRLYDKNTLTALSPTGLATNGEVEDYQHSWAPTAVELLRFEAAAQGEAVLLAWETATELDNLGFNLYRSASPAGPWVLVNAALIPAQAPGAVFGAVYELLDTEVTPGAPMYYRLEDVDIHGVSTFHGPISITLAGPSAVSLVSFGATSAPFGLLPALLALGALGLAHKRRK